jgi:hypothetical protein
LTSYTDTKNGYLINIFNQELDLHIFLSPNAFCFDPRAMATTRANPRLQVGSATWIVGERSSALQLAELEAEEFTFSARNEIEWLNEHMAEVFSKNQV